MKNLSLLFVVILSLGVGMLLGDNPAVKDLIGLDTVASVPGTPPAADLPPGNIALPELDFIPLPISGTSATNRANSNTAVVATFDGINIYKSEAEEVITRLMARQNLENKPYDSLKKKEKIAVTKEIATKKLLQNAIDASQISNDKEIQKNLQIVIKELIQKAFLERKAREDVTPKKIKEHYHKVVADIGDKKEVRLRHILVEMKADADKIYKAVIKTPASFAKIAKEKSKDPSAANGGDTGYALESLFVKEIRDVALSLKKGKISKPIKTKLGWSIIKLEDRRKAAILPFEKIKGKVEKELVKLNIQKYIKSLLDGIKIELIEKKS